MHIEVRYLSKSGNTKKVADAIAQATGCEALSIEHGVAQDTDVLFLGAAVYAAGVDQQMKDFINQLGANIKKVVVFSTSAVLKSSYPQMKKLLEERNIKVDSREFHCRGAFAVMHKGRPNADDLAAAKKFAKGIVG